MDWAVLRSHGPVGNRHAADELRPSPPAKPGGGTSRTRHGRATPRQVPGTPRHGGASSPGGRSPPSRTRPSHKGGSDGGGGVGGGVTPGRSGRRGRIPEPHGPMVVKGSGKRLVMEEVTILKRGEGVMPQLQGEEDPRPSDREEAAAEEANGDDLALSPADRLGPDPEILPRQMRPVEGKPPHLYAGSGFLTSPSPRSLPFPTFFFAKKEVATTTDLATRGLRYLLPLDLP